MTQPTTRPVVAGIDGSAESRAAASWAAREAVNRDLPLHLVHAWIDEPLYAPPAPDEGQARRMLEEVGEALAAAHPRLPITTELLPQTATAGLIEKNADAAMLVLGSRGHGAIVGFLLGSVGLPVLAHSTRPVVFVRADVPQRPDAQDEVVVALKDLGAPAERLLDFAFTAATARDAAVRVVRVWGGAPSFFGSDVPENLEDHRTHEKVETLQGRMLAEALDPWRSRYPRVPLIEHLRFGNASEELLAAAAFRAALIVTGRRVHRSPLGLRVGPVVHAVLHHAHAPVAVVPYE